MSEEVESLRAEVRRLRAENLDLRHRAMVAEALSEHLLERGAVAVESVCPGAGAAWDPFGEAEGDA